jgi:hypothetical protein
MLADLIPKKYRGPGLSEGELAAAQEQAGATFPPDLCELLIATLPSGEEFPDWRHRPQQEMSEWRERLIGSIHFDVINNEFWMPEWGPVPGDPRESRAIVAQAVADAPALIPIFLHRAIPNEPLEDGNPVFSIWQTDIVVYGSDLARYLVHEFHPWRPKIPFHPWRSKVPPVPLRRQDNRRIRFWSHMLYISDLYEFFRLPDGRLLAYEQYPAETPWRCWIVEDPIVEDPDRMIVGAPPVTAIADLVGIPRGAEPDWVHSMAERISERVTVS